MLKVLFLFYGAFSIGHLEVNEVRDSNPNYEDFCKRHTSECQAQGAESIKLSEGVLNVLSSVNLLVNQSVPFILDQDQYGLEEHWNLPTEMGGDCEDNALVKRKILVEDYGLPRSALRMMTAFHKEIFYAHALLAVVTDSGTFILDQDNDSVVESKNAAYIIEAIEMPDRKWMRFYQEW